MRQLMVWGIILAALAANAGTAGASGAPYRLLAFGTAGADPAVTVVVTDANGLGCQGVAVSISVTAGAGLPSLTSTVTDANGSTRVAIAGSVAGDTVAIFCGQASAGVSTTVTAFAGRAVAATDAVAAWFGEASHMVYAAVVDPASRVMVTTNAGSVDDDDIASSDSDNKRLTFGLVLMQDALQPYRRVVYQGTYSTNNVITVNVDDITGAPDASLSLASLSVNRLLSAFAAGGADPEITAVVTDLNGCGIAGVTITAAATAGSVTPGSALTNTKGVAQFYQTGGALGDTVTVRANLAETQPVTIVTQDSVPLSATSLVCSWFERTTRRIYTAVLEQESNVLVQSTADLRRDVVELSVDARYPYTGEFLEQDSGHPGSSFVVSGGSEAGDMIRIYHYGTLHRYPGGPTYGSGYYSNSILTLPANESRYLMACAAPGTSPKLWAMVTDGEGNAVTNVPVSFALQGSGVLDLANTVTGWSGRAVNQVTAGAIGTTVTVTSPGLGAIPIYLSDVQAPRAEDRVLGLYDASTHMVYCALVEPENNVMTDTFAQTQMLGYDELDQTPGNGVSASLSYYFSPQTTIKFCQGYAGFGTIGAGDILRLNSTFTNPGYDCYLTVAADPAEFLLAFATTGTTPEIWAVVMDQYGNGVSNRALTFATTGGSLSAPAVTNAGGFAVAQATAAIAYGNTVTVTSPGLPPVVIWPSPGQNYVGSDKAFMWFDPTTLQLRHAVVTMDRNVMTLNAGLGNANLQVLDNTPNDRLLEKGYIYDQSGSSTPQRVGTAFLVFGTPSVGDVITANFGTSNDCEDRITIQRLNSLYLQAYAEYGSSPNIVGVVTDQDGNGLPGYNVAFSSTYGTLQPPPPGGFKTDINGMVKALYTQASGWGEKITVSTSDFESVPVDVITYNQTDIQAYYKAVPFYNRREHKVNVAFVHEYFNTMPYTATSIPIEEILAVDRTANDKTVSVGPLQDQGVNRQAAAFLAFGTNAEYDQVSINDNTAVGSPDALITLRPDVDKYLMAYATAGASPVTITAVVVDEYGNGLAGEQVDFTSGGGSLSVSSTATDAGGKAVTVLTGAGLGTAVYIDAPLSVSFTVQATTASSGAVAADSRVYPWYSVLEKTGYAAVVTRANNVLATGSSVLFTPQDMTANGRVFALDSPVQQTGNEPARVSVTAGTQGEGDRIIAAEAFTLADPDAVMAVHVPTSEIVATAGIAPAVASLGQPLTFTLLVFNNGTPAALSVSPTAVGLSGTGAAAWVSGPTPTAHALIPGGESRSFTWTYLPTAAGTLAFSSQALGIDSFTLGAIASQSATSTAVSLQTPAQLSLAVNTPANAERLAEFAITVTVVNSGQALARGVTPGPLVLTSASTTTATTVTAYSPLSADIAGGGSQDFLITYRAGEVGALQFRTSVQGVDANSGDTVTAAAADSGLLQVIQGALNIDRVASPASEIYQGQRGIPVSMEARNTSLMPVTITAATLRFNNQLAGFSVRPLAGNPAWVGPQGSVTLGFQVDAGTDAPLGLVTLNATLSGDSAAGAMTAVSADQTAAWTVYRAFNQLRQNYPNPLRLGQHAYTTFEFFVRENSEVSLKMYNLAGELVAVLYEGRPGVGRHAVQWRGDNGSPGSRGKTVGSGVYLAVFKSGDYQEIKKAVVIR
ncbi:MAG: Ig-like domain-containing protein [candidate division FCPU426 bacterium]